MTHPLFTKHEATLNQALAAIATRGYWSPFPEMPSPKVYGETANSDGEAAFKAHLNRTFELDQPSTGETVGNERSPFGFALGIRYPKADVDALLAASARRTSSMARGRPRRVGRRKPRNSGAAEQSELRDRLQRHAHDRTGLHDGLSGGRPACAGSRARSGGLRVGPASPHSRRRSLGKAARQKSAARDAQALHRRAARHGSCARLLHLPDVERLSRACSPIWPRATRSSSNRIRARSCRWQLPYASRATFCAKPDSIRTWSRCLRPKPTMARSFRISLCAPRSS